jgi:flagellar biosynthesis/type III secretory pathway M-ring protein FliF/YscJ
VLIAAGIAAALIAVIAGVVMYQRQTASTPLTNSPLSGKRLDVPVNMDGENSDDMQKYYREQEG